MTCHSLQGATGAPFFSLTRAVPHKRWRGQSSSPRKSWHALRTTEKIMRKKGPQGMDQYDHLRCGNMWKSPSRNPHQCCDPRCHESKSVGGQEFHLQKRDPWSLALLQPIVVFSLTVSFRISCLLMFTVYFNYCICKALFNHFLLGVYVVFQLSFDLVDSCAILTWLRKESKFAIQVEDWEPAAGCPSRFQALHEVVSRQTLRKDTMHLVPSHIPCLMHKDATQTMSQP